MGEEGYRRFSDRFLDDFFGPEDARDRLIGRCAEQGIYTILDLHALPGAQNQHWHSDNPMHRAQFWVHRPFQDRVVHL
ncbi:hypothetical protein AB0I91_39625 [Actinosynnema sp. NPDC049800]